jgi:di/tripeptidase
MLDWNQEQVSHFYFSLFSVEAKYPGLEMISFGALEQGAHSPDERVLISSVPQSYALAFKIIENFSKSN